MRNLAPLSFQPALFTRVVAGLFLAVVWALPGNASASLLTSVTVGAGQNSDSKQSTTTAVVTSVSGTGDLGATAGASASADFGTLGALASGQASGGGAFPVIFADASASYNDSIQVLSSDTGLTSASVTFELALAGGCFATDGATAGFVNAACGAQGAMSVGNQGFGVIWGGLTSNSLTLTVPVNAVIPISAFLDARGFANFGTFLADFGSTLHTYIFSDLAGITIKSESGHDYSLPGATGGGGSNAVPEPGTLAALSLGLAALGVARRRKPTPARIANSPGHAESRWGPRRLGAAVL